MAIVKYGTNIAGIRRTIGGVTFGKSGSTPSCRVWRPSTMSYTPAQTEVQARISQLVPAWQALTAGQRADWNSLGAAPPETDVNSLGQTYLLSGWQWFIRCNSRLLASDLPLQLTAPSGVVANPAQFAFLVWMVGTTPHAVWQFTFSQWTALHKAVLFVACNRLHGNTKPTTNFFRLGTFTPVADNYVLCGTEFATVFPSPAVGDSVFATCHQQSPGGIRSAVRTATFIVQ